MKWKKEYYLAYNKTKKLSDENLSEAILALDGCLEKVLTLIDETLNGEEQLKALLDVYTKTAVMSRILFEKSTANCDAVATSYIMYHLSEKIRIIFGDEYSNIAYQSWMCGVNITRKCGGIEELF